MKPMHFKLPFSSLLAEAEAIFAFADVLAHRVELLGNGATKTRMKLRNMIQCAYKAALWLRVREDLKGKA